MSAAESIGPATPGGVRVERVVTSGTFCLDGGEWEVDNNVWLVGDDTDVLVLDAGHEAAPIAAAVGDRRLIAVVCTHGHNDHIDAVLDLVADHPDAVVRLHDADRMLWDATYPDTPPGASLTDGQTITVGDLELTIVYTPGHSPGAVSLYAPALATVFSGDTLFSGGPGATGRSYSDFDTIIDSIQDRLLTLPPETVVLTGHGESTTIGAEAPHLAEWIASGP